MTVNASDHAAALSQPLRTPRRQHLVELLHAAGPRPVFEALLEVEAGHQLDDVLARFCRIPAAVYHAVGADQLPIRNLTTITGGRR